MWWIAIFLMQDVPAQSAGSQAERARAAMASSIEHQREAIKRQEAAIRSTPAGMHAAETAASWTPAILATCDPGCRNPSLPA